MKKRALSLVLTLVMLASLLAACSSSGTPDSGTTDTPAETADTADTADAADAADTDTAAEAPAATSGESEYTVHIVSSTSGDSSDDFKIAEAASAIALEKIGCDVKLTMINSGSYKEQINLMLSSGEDLDLFAITGTPMSTYVANGQILPLDDLIAEHGQGILDTIDSAYIDAGKIGGELFGVVTNRDLATYVGFYMIKELADKHGFDYNGITTLDQLEEALIMMRDAEPDYYPTVMNKRTMLWSWSWDNLGAPQVPLGVLLNDGLEDTTVVNLFESQDYKDWVTRMYRWANEKLFSPDYNSEDSAESMMKANKVFGSMSTLKPNSYVTKARSSTHEVEIAKLRPALSTSTNIQFHLWGIATNSKNPEKAMQMLNLMYTDRDINNLFIFGIEGEHYKVIDAENDVIDYADGVDATTTKYTPIMGWSWPNQYLGHIWNGDKLDVWEELDEFNKTATRSKAMGFVFDATNVKNEITACTSVVEKYHAALMCGALNPDETLDRFNSELKDAGLEAVIAEKQKQLDEQLGL